MDEDMEIQTVSSGPVDNAWAMKIPEFKPEHNPNRYIFKYSRNLYKLQLNLSNHFANCWSLTHQAIGIALFDY